VYKSLVTSSTVLSTTIRDRLCRSPALLITGNRNGAQDPRTVVLSQLLAAWYAGYGKSTQGMYASVCVLTSSYFPFLVSRAMTAIPFPLSRLRQIRHSNASAGHAQR
jgi:hypothetical protein